MADLKEDLFNAWLYSWVNKLMPNTMGWNIISIFTNSCLPFNKSEVQNIWSFGSSRSVKTREADQNHYLLYFTSFLVSFSRLLSPNWVRSLAKVNALVFFGQLLSFWQNERSQRPNISHPTNHSKCPPFQAIKSMILYIF